MTTSAETSAAPSSRVNTALARLRVWLRIAWAITCRASIVTARCVLTLVLVIRIGWIWTRWAEGTGIAKRTKQQKTAWSVGEDGQPKRTAHTVEKVHGLPRIRGWEIGQHGATMRVKIPIGKDPSNFAQSMPALRHAARVQSAEVRELDPGFIAIDLLRRDPLDRVAITPHPSGPDRFVVGLDDHGRNAELDFGQSPHWLFTGANGSGKSGWQLSGMAAMAPADDVLLGWDLKWGLEAQVMAPRLSGVATTRDEVKNHADRLVELAGQRAALLSQLQCRNITELEDRHGIRLRRIRVWCDEVAELGLDTAESESTADEVLAQLLRITQLVRALGINVVVCGQRFGADMGKKITAIRAQLGGRVVCRVHDKETAQMALPGMPDEFLSQVMGLDRPGLALVKLDGERCSLRRPPYLSFDQARRIAEKHADKAIGLDEVHADDRHRLGRLISDDTTVSPVPEMELAA